MRDDWARKSNIPNKSNEFSLQEASFWPATYTLLGVKSMAISAVSTCFWRVKWRKWNCIGISETHKQLCISKIRKLLMLGVFAPTRRVGYLHAKYKEARCQEKIPTQCLADAPLTPSRIWAVWCIFNAPFEYSSNQNRITFPDFATCS